MRVEDADEVLRHSLISVKAAVFARIQRQYLVPLGQRYRAEIVEIGISVLPALFECVAQLGFTYQFDSVSVRKHIC